MIRIEHLTKRYDRTIALNDISLHIKTGDIVGFLGPNGAGKTTTMKLIMGLIKPSSGSVLVNGQSPLANRIDVVSKVGYLPENNPLYPEMIVSEYLSWIADIKHAPHSQIASLIQNVSLEEVLESKIDELSRGFRQRVGLAAALLSKPSILILDEPTSGLDPLEQDKIKSLIRTFAQDKIVIFSTHILSEVEDVASRLVIIHKGSIVFDDAKPKGKGAVEILFKKLITNANH